MVSIKFEYADEMSNWEWRTQHCVVSSIEECKRIYGLGVDCKYRILSVEEVLEIRKTTDFFNITKEEAARKINESDTKEEAMVLDSGLEHFFFETLEGLKKEYASKERQEYTRAKGYEVLLFEFVANNSNHNKYCMVFR